MKAAASKHFFLSAFALLAPTASCIDTKSDFCPISSKSIVEDACASYATLERLNAEVKPAIDDLTRQTDYFSHYRLNLFNKKCPFWSDEDGKCGNEGCAVVTLDKEEDIPPSWRAKELGKLEGPRAKHPARGFQKQHPQRPLQGELGDAVSEPCVVEYDDECDDRDYCVPEDEVAAGKGDYVSLIANPEKFTGYSGESGAWQVWNAIYSENCFSKASFPHSANLGSSPFGGGMGVAKQDFKQILNAAGRQAQLEQWASQGHEGPPVPNPAEDECLEKRVFYRVVSGMHASISAHLCWNYLNQSDPGSGVWGPNVQCYTRRLHEHPERISNLYFNYALVTRAVAKLGPYLQNPEYKFCTGDSSEDAITRAKVLEVTDRAASVPQPIDESLLFVNGEGPSLKEDFRQRFRNISRMMDCVGCDKCRLWGKVQTAGYGTALKALFEIDNNADAAELPPLRRQEIVALFNTYARLSNSIYAVGQFRDMVDGSKKVVEEIIEEKKADDQAAQEDAEHVGEREQEQDYEYEEETLSDVFGQEFAQVKKAVNLVLSSWVGVPSAVWNVITSESLRFWQGFLGRPVNPRNWEFRLPKMEDHEDL